MTKAEAVAKRAVYRAQRKAERHAEWRCWWTRPLGHVWHYEDRIGLTFFYKCAACRKTKVTP
jgi:hypothetical protein